MITMTVSLALMNDFIFSSAIINDYKMTVSSAIMNDLIVSSAIMNDSIVSSQI